VRVNLLLGCLLAATASCLASSAFAQAPRRVRFEYARQEGAAACPDPAAIQAGVAARLGYEPFGERGGDLVRATIHKTGRGLEARIEMLDEGGGLKAERTLLSHQRDCAELASSVELAISIAIDPFRLDTAPPATERREPAPEATSLSGTGPSAASAQGGPVAGPSVASVAQEPVAPSTPGRPLSGRVEAGLLGAMGTAPAAAPGFSAGVGIRRGDVSLALEGRADLSASTSLPIGGTSASTSLLLASLLPCAHFRMLATCALVSAGALRAAGHGLRDARTVTLPYLAAGARLAIAIPLTTRLSLAIHGDLTTPLIETRVEVDGAAVWTSPVLAFALGAGMAAHFP
jgi:hypothetical protein